MTDFRAAFQLGQEAAMNAEMARREIDSVFKEINAQLAEPTEGKIEIYRGEFDKKSSGLFGSLTTSWPISRETYLAIAARNPKAANRGGVELARWEVERGGYPCEVSWGGVEHTCHDRESLEASLALLLKDAIVGEKLRSLMMLPPQTSGKDGTTGPS